MHSVSSCTTCRRCSVRSAACSRKGRGCLTSCSEVLSSGIVKAIRASFWVRVFVVVVTMMGWVVLSNHCALGGMANRLHGGAHSCCAKTESTSHQAPTKCPPVMECCKTMRAVVPDVVQVNQPAVWAVVLTFAEALFLFPTPPVDSASAFADSGLPDRASTFSELVLQQSLLSHAPPVSA